MALAVCRSRTARPAVGAQRAAVRLPGRVVALRSSAAPAVETATVQTSSTVISLTSDEYDDFIAAHPEVVIDYFTQWCGPCKMIAPHLEQMAAEMPGVKFAKLDCTTDAAAKKIAMSAGIKALPTFHYFKNSQRVGVFVGGKPTQLRKFVCEHSA